MVVACSREKRLVYEPLHETYTSRIRIYDFLYTIRHIRHRIPFVYILTVYRSYMVSVFGFVYI